MPIESLLNQTCDIYAGGTLGRDGKEVYNGTPTTSDAKCRAESESREIKNADGVVITTDTTIFMLPTETVKRGDKVVVDSVSYYTEQVNNMRGLYSLNHYEVLCTEIA